MFGPSGRCCPIVATTATLWQVRPLRLLRLCLSCSLISVFLSHIRPTLSGCPTAVPLRYLAVHVYSALTTPFLSPTASESLCGISFVLGNFSSRHSHSLSGRCRYSNRHRADHCSDRIPATPRSLSDLRPLLILSGHLHLCVLCCLSSFSPYRPDVRKSVRLCLGHCSVVGGLAPAL